MSERGDEDAPPAEDGERFKVDFTYSQKYDHLPANGVMGGLQPRGDCKFEFFVEHFPAPHSQEASTKEGQRFVHKEDYSADVVRQIQFAIQCSPNEAIRMGLYMISQATDTDPDLLWETLSDSILEQQGDQP